jgi:hypothetical protein
MLYHLIQNQDGEMSDDEIKQEDIEKFNQMFKPKQQEEDKSTSLLYI